MNPGTIEEAARLLIAARNGGALIERLDEALQPATVDAAHAIQDATVTQLDDTVAGWRVTSFDPAELLDTDEGMAVFMADAFETGDSAFIAHCLGIVARAKGMRQIADETGLSRESLDHSFSEKGNPTLRTTLAVMKALGIKLTADTMQAPRAA
jgi:probable addiction module antidote protein